MSTRSSGDCGATCPFDGQITLITKQLNEREFIDYKTSMITDDDPLRGLLFY